MHKKNRVPTKTSIWQHIRESDACFAAALLCGLFAFIAVAEFLCWIVGAADPSLTIYK